MPFIIRKMGYSYIMNGKKMWIKKGILVLLIVYMGIFVYTQKALFYVEKTYAEGNWESSTEDKTEQEISLLGNQQIEQEFIAKETELTKVLIDFRANEQKNGSGSILVEIQDQEGKVVASAQKAVTKLVQSKSGITTTFSVPASLKKDQIYKVVITSQDVKSEKGVFLLGVGNKGTLFGDLEVNGAASEGRIRMKMKLIELQWESLAQLLAILFGAAIFVMIPWEMVGRRISDGRKYTIDLNRFFSRVFFFCSPVVAFFVVQRYSGYEFGEFYSLMVKLKGLLNLFLYGMVWWILYLITNRTRYTAVILVGGSSLLGLANYFVWMLRGTPVMMADLASVGTAMDVAAGYEYTLDLSSVWAIACTVAFLCMVLSLKNYRGLGWKQRICFAAAFLIPFRFYETQLRYGTYLKDHKITVSVWEPSRNYASNGSLLSFFLSYTYYTVDRPDGYSVQKAEEIAAQYASDTVQEGEKAEGPNVIAIMNEAFSDLLVDGNLPVSEDPIPYVRNLKENTVKGKLFVSVMGGNTANTEFEFLTGCSMAFMPYRAIPYNTYIKKELPSLTWNFRKLGYTGNYAVHPYSRTAWNRDTVYPLLGFEEYFSKNDIEEIQYVRNFASDQSDFDFIISKYEESRAKSDDPFYTFTVTVQNHGGYEEAQGLVDTEIKITDEALQNDQAEQYLNLIKKSDDAFKNLTEYFSRVEEPTVIVMFGDHQPSLPSEFYEKLFGKASKDYVLEDVINKYTVPYVIWANYDIREEEVDMSSNYLSSYLMKVIGGKMTGYQKFLLELQKKIPMITANGYRGDDGVLHELDEESEYSDLINQYQILQYNNMFDSANRLNDFYEMRDSYDQ